MAGSGGWLTNIPVDVQHPISAPDMRLRLLLSLLCVNFVLARFADATDSQSPEKQAVIAFVHVNVIPMDRERVLADQTVVIEGDRIKQIGPSKSIKLQATIQQIEAKGSYLIPGLVDAMCICNRRMNSRLLPRTA